MERILNDEEKIKKAEDIYFRRNNQLYSLQTRKKEKKSKFLKEKIILNLIIMFDLAVIVFCVQNSEFIFTKEFLQMLSKYNNEASNKIVSLFNDFLKNEDEDYLVDENNIDMENANKVVIEENNIENETNIVENSISSMNEMELDIQNLKNAYKFVVPLNGTVSSEFGARESKYQNVRGYHTGVDIAAENGTPINASMQGIVELVSDEGDYGKHIKIRCNNVYTLYAHCSKIFVKEGQIVAEGQKIASVGNTGNSTGPHLHFEIKVEDRFVDPEELINF